METANLGQEISLSCAYTHLVHGTKKKKKNRAWVLAKHAQIRDYYAQEGIQEHGVKKKKEKIYGNQG